MHVYHARMSCLVHSLRLYNIHMYKYSKNKFTDSVQRNGELVSRLEQHASADATGNEKPHVHAQTQLDLPAQDVHKVVVQDGTHISVMDATTATTLAPEEQTTKVKLS